MENTMLTRRTVLIGLLATPAVFAVTRGLAALPAPDTLQTAAGDLTIQPLNHATLILSQGDHVFYFDPAKVDFSGRPPATAIFITHEHPDHFDPDNLSKIAGKAQIIATQTVAEKIPAALKGQVTVMKNGDSGTVDGIQVSAVPAYNTSPDKQKYHPKGVGNGYVLTFGDKKIYVAGDTENTPEMAALTGIDVAFLPMNQPYTMTPEQVADAVKAFKPKIVYPYHYQGSDPQKLADLVGNAAEVRLRDWYAKP
jgi:L-ascorbate metabolism protein UlaG (beta-lactamase superfamily)